MAPASAAPEGTVDTFNFVVTDVDNKPVEGATITLTIDSYKNKAGMVVTTQVYSQKTGKDGTPLKLFSGYTVPKGIQASVTVIKEGYALFAIHQEFEEAVKNGGKTGFYSLKLQKSIINQPTKTPKINFQQFKVIDTDNKAIEGADVHVKNTVDKKSDTETTSSNGLTNGVYIVAGGTYDIEVSKRGYDTSRQSRTFGDSNEIILVTLKKTPSPTKATETEISLTISAMDKNTGNLVKDVTLTIFDCERKTGYDYIMSKGTYTISKITSDRHLVEDMDLILTASAVGYSESKQSIRIKKNGNKVILNLAPSSKPKTSETQNIHSPDGDGYKSDDYKGGAQSFLTKWLNMAVQFGGLVFLLLFMFFVRKVLK